MAALEKRGLRIAARSRILTTPPWPPGQPWYSNAVVRVETDLPPRTVFSILQDIENEFGRVRAERNTPRVIDLDLLAYNDVVLNDPDLVIPHPRMHERAFVLWPLRDIAPGWVHPVLKRPVPPGPVIGGTPLIMGILNVTPDSFSDGGQFFSPARAIDRGRQMVAEGADIIDIGGESTRPGADPVIPAEEIERILPVIEGLRDCGALLSVDTRHAETMKAALAAGAGMINDVSGLQYDSASLSVAASSQAYICLMHSQGTPQTMQKNPQYQNVVEEVFRSLSKRIVACEAAGIEKIRILADPGIGFGKNLDHNLALLRNVAEFKKLDVPILIGVSRKSFIGNIAGGAPEDQRLSGSIAAVLWCLQQGVTLFRVHDVRETRQAFDVWQAISGSA